jgi:hypothetical protein
VGSSSSVREGPHRRSSLTSRRVSSCCLVLAWPRMCVTTSPSTATSCRGPACSSASTAASTLPSCRSFLTLLAMALSFFPSFPWPSPSSTLDTTWPAPSRAARARSTLAVAGGLLTSSTTACSRCVVRASAGAESAKRPLSRSNGSPKPCSSARSSSSSPSSFGLSPVRKSSAGSSGLSGAAPLSDASAARSASRLKAWG